MVSCSLKALDAKCNTTRCSSKEPPRQIADLGRGGGLDRFSYVLYRLKLGLVQSLSRNKKLASFRYFFTLASQFENNILRLNGA